MTQTETRGRGALAVPGTTVGRTAAGQEANEVAATGEQRPTRRRAGRPALWRRVQDDIVARIDAGEFTDRFPGEHALAEEYGASRQTVRLALRSLREAGVLTAAPGHAPRVNRPIRQPMGTLYSLFAAVEGSGRRQESIVRALDERQDAVAADRLGLPATEPLVHLDRVRLVDGEPLAWDRAWLPASLTRPLLDADFTRTALYREMSVRLGVRPHDGHEEIDAVTLTDDQAWLLGAEPGRPAFSLSRITSWHTDPVEWRLTLIRADRFRLVVDFDSVTGYHLRSTDEGSARC